MIYNHMAAVHKSIMNDDHDVGVAANLSHTRVSTRTCDAHNACLAALLRLSTRKSVVGCDAYKTCLAPLGVSVAACARKTLSGTRTRRKKDMNNVSMLPLSMRLPRILIKNPNLHRKPCAASGCGWLVDRS